MQKIHFLKGRKKIQQPKLRKTHLTSKDTVVVDVDFILHERASSMRDDEIFIRFEQNFSLTANIYVISLN